MVIVMQNTIDDDEDEVDVADKTDEIDVNEL